MNWSVQAAAASKLSLALQIVIFVVALAALVSIIVAFILVPRAVIERQLVWHRPKRPGALTAKDLDPGRQVRLHLGKKNRSVTATVVRRSLIHVRVKLIPWSWTTRLFPFCSFELDDLGAAPYKDDRWHRYNWVEECDLGKRAPESALQPDRPPHFFISKRILHSSTLVAFISGIIAGLLAVDKGGRKLSFTLLAFILVIYVGYELSQRAFQHLRLARAERMVQQSGRDAVAFCRDLDRPDRRPDLASLLNNLGGWFSELGRPADALLVTEEAVAMCRKLTTSNPNRYAPDLASSLNNLGVRFSELGRPADALVVTEEAVDIYRQAIHQIVIPDWRRRRRRARYPGELASALNNLGAWFSELGRPADALPVTEEAVAIYRKLAAADPDHYRPDLASSLTQLAVIHEMLGQMVRAETLRDEAMKVTEASI